MMVGSVSRQVFPGNQSLTELRYNFLLFSFLSHVIFS